MVKKKKQFTRAFIAGCPAWATITHGDFHFNCRCYESFENCLAGVYYVKINYSWYSVEELERFGSTVKIWF